MCKWLVEAGVDAVHVSTGSAFPHPRNPAGAELPVELLSPAPTSSSRRAARNTFRNLLLFHNDLTAAIFRKQWLDAGVPEPDQIEGLSLPDARVIKQAVTVPVICTGGFQTASVIRDGDHRRRLRRRSAWPGRSSPTTTSSTSSPPAATSAERPCTYCNKCLVHVVEHPIGCYEESGSLEPRSDAGGRDVGVSIRRRLQ